MSQPAIALPTSSSFVQGDATWKRLRERALTDLYFFNDIVLGYGPKIPMSPQEHLLMCRFAEGRTGSKLIDEAHYKKIEVPREVGKTTAITQGRAIQRICANPDISILIANETFDTACTFLAEIKFQFEHNELLRALFPELVWENTNDTTWSASEIIVKRPNSRKEPTVFVTGEGGTKTGMHPDLIIVDDIISKESMENARVGDGGIMERVNRWINQLEMLLSSNAQPFPEIIFIGTRWWFGDTYEYIEKKYGHDEKPQYVRLKGIAADGTSIEMPLTGCYRVGDLAVFRRSGYEDGRVAFPSKWSAERMEKVRIEDPVLFSCNIQNNPADEATAVFRPSWLKYYHWIDERAVLFTDLAGKKRTLRPSDLDILMFVDPGGFAQNSVEQRAQAAIIVSGSTGNGEHLILEAYSRKEPFLDAAKKIVEFASKYGPRKVVVELAGQQAAFIEVVRNVATKAGVQLSLHPEKPGLKQKGNRILELEPYFQRGQIYVRRDAEFAEFREQYDRFPRSARVDVLDALAYGPRFWKRESVGSGNIEERRTAELNAYWARRGGRSFS